MMNKILAIYFLLCSVTGFAQDVIVKKDGSTILAKVIEIGISEVKYKKFSNQNGPTYTTEKSEIMSINYENGEKDSFSDFVNAQKQNQADGMPLLIEKKADERNSTLLALYNRDYELTDKVKLNNSYAKCYAYILGVKSASIMSNEDIEMNFVREERNNPNGYRECVFNIQLKNKSDRTIYIDKGSCFRINGNGTYKCYYGSTEQISVTRGKGSGASLGLGSVAGAFGIGGKIGQLAGGVNVGGGSSNTVSKTYTQERVLAIPPHSVSYLCNPNFVKTRGYQFFGDQHSIHETMEDAEILRDFSTGIGKKDIKNGEIRNYDENSSPDSRTFIITYSSDNQFKSYSTIQIELYIRKIYGGDFPKSFSIDGINLENFFEGVDENTIFGGGSIIVNDKIAKKEKKVGKSYEKEW